MSGSEAKICQNCQASFVIDASDFAFYEKIKVPPPTWCPECRMIRRFSFFNVWSLYRRTCAKCGKGTMSMYSPDKQKTIYCQPCWWGDAWDGREYGREYDPGRPFLAQVRDLIGATPWCALESDYLTIKNCDYANALGHCKDCYMIFWADYCENVYHSTFINGLKDSLDSYRMKESELCYECVGGNKCYRTFFSEECDACTNVWFSRSCFSCTDCLGCVNLRGKSYCIFNEQFSREDYYSKLKEFRLDSRAALQELRKRAESFWIEHPRRVYIGNALNVHATGDYVYESKNARDIYMASGVEDSRYVQFVSVPTAKDCYDYSGWGNRAELVYEAIVVGEGSNNVKFSFECWPEALDNEYSIYAISSKHVLGCVNLKRQDYCILNKQYSKEEYERLSRHIREDMAKNPYIDGAGRTWSYGEFLPSEFSSYAYNETLAHRLFPKTKEQVLTEGLKWYEGPTNEYTITLQGRDLPDAAGSIDEAVVKEIVACEVCGRAYRFISAEVSLMKKLSLPLPAACPACRQKARFDRTNLPRLYDRSCAKCNKPVKTSYAPERPEIVYCESCYQAEVA